MAQLSPKKDKMLRLSRKRYAQIWLVGTRRSCRFERTAAQPAGTTPSQGFIFMCELSSVQCGVLPRPKIPGCDVAACLVGCAHE